MSVRDCHSKDWDSDAGKDSMNGKQAETINKKLELINYQALQALDQLKFSRTPFTIDELVSELKVGEERPVLCIDDSTRSSSCC